MMSDSSRIVGCSKMSLTNSCTLNVLLIWAHKLIADNESPPISKNESSILICSIFSSVLKIDIKSLSTSFLGRLI